MKILKLNNLARGSMQHKYLMIPALFVSYAMLAGVAQSAQTDDSHNSARIRVYQEANITLYPGEYCYGSDSKQAIKASETGFSIFGSNKRVGMPVTEDIAGSYNEYMIPAGMPLTVMLQWEAEKNGVKASCGPIGSTFYPQAGKDYDVTIGNSGSCIVQVRELFESTSGKASARPAPAGYSFACAYK